MSLIEHTSNRLLQRLSALQPVLQRGDVGRYRIEQEPHRQPTPPVVPVWPQRTALPRIVVPQMLRAFEAMPLFSLPHHLVPQRPLPVEHQAPLSLDWHDPADRAANGGSAGATALRQATRHAGVDNRAQMLGRAGRPKMNLHFGMLGSIKNSVGYRVYLAELDHYHEQLGYAKASRGTDNIEADLVRLRDHLRVLEDAGDHYIAKSGHTRKSEIGENHSRVRAERALIESLLIDLRAGEQVPDHISLDLILSYARQGIGLRDIADFVRDGLSPTAARQRIWDTPLASQDYQPYHQEVPPFTADEARLLERSGLGLEGGRAYRANTVPITEETVPRFGKSELAQPMQPIGSGKFNTVYAARYNTCDGVSERVFKPFTPNEKLGFAGVKTGIDRHQPNLAMRNLASFELASELGFDVIAHTEFAPRMGEGMQVGILMERAPGYSGAAGWWNSNDHPGLRRELTKLQLLDHLIAQGDRHYNNYFIHVDENQQVKVTGIDNDQCFGKSIHDPNELVYRNTPSHCGFRGTRLPEIVDQTMMAAFSALTPERLEEILSGKLTQAEIDAAKDRLQAIHNHLGQLEKNGQVIADAQWANDRRVLPYLSNPQTSYFARDTIFDDQMF